MEIEITAPETKAATPPANTDNGQQQPATPPVENQKKGDFKLKTKAPEKGKETPAKTVEQQAQQTSATTEPAKVEPSATGVPDIDFSKPEENKSGNAAAKPAEQAKPSDWRESIKGVDRAELLKELGIEDDDEFEKEFKKFRRSGGDPYKYLEAKTKDWTKMDNKAVAMQALADKNPSLSQDELNILFNNKYKLGEEATEEEKTLGNILMKSDAESKRAEEIEKQKSFVIPDSNTKVVPPEEAIRQYQQQLAKEQQEKLQQSQQEYLQNEAVKSLMESKKVAMSAGKFGNFNLGIDPQEVVSYFTDPKTYAKYTFNEKGEPDIAKEQSLAIIKIIGLDKYNEALLNYGKQLATKELVEEGQNAQRPNSIPASAEKQKPVWRSTN